MRKVWLLLSLVGGLAACGDPEPARTTGDGGARSEAGSTAEGGSLDGGSTSDARAAMGDASGAQDAFEEVVHLGPQRSEICGNNFDDNGNGQVDEGCDCAVGTERPCWFGPLAARGVGVCRDGIQSCMSTGASAVWGGCTGEVLPGSEVLGNSLDDNCDGRVDEPGGICAPTSNVERGAGCADGVDNDCNSLVDCQDPGCAADTHCMRRCAATETLCWGGVDEDCDGDIDCADRDCATSPSCQTGPCPTGQTPLYTQRPNTLGATSSGVLPGDSMPVMPVTCVPGRCATGQVAVQLLGQPQVCVPPPGPCPTGQSPQYSGGAWRCVAPCEVIVQFGFMYGFRRVCAPRPPSSCPMGQVPTFDAATEQWVCRTTCNNTTYDQVLLGGAVVCVPC